MLNLVYLALFNLTFWRTYFSGKNVRFPAEFFFLLRLLSYDMVSQNKQPFMETGGKPGILNGESTTSPHFSVSYMYRRPRSCSGIGVCDGLDLWSLI
jgi:hypothetical protein